VWCWGGRGGRATRKGNERGSLVHHVKVPVLFMYVLSYVCALVSLNEKGQRRVGGRSKLRAVVGSWKSVPGEFRSWAWLLASVCPLVRQTTRKHSHPHSFPYSSQPRIQHKYRPTSGTLLRPAPPSTLPTPPSSLYGRPPACHGVARTPPWSLRPRGCRLGLECQCPALPPREHGAHRADGRRVRLGQVRRGGRVPLEGQGGRGRKPLYCQVQQ